MNYLMIQFQDTNIKYFSRGFLSCIFIIEYRIELDIAYCYIMFYITFGLFRMKEYCIGTVTFL